uniref:peptidylprolyl isomerase n=2 Tax=Amorphochlora amoebiformis TaxID=1561963 RepID=A0A7S0DJQ2_9EUKA
MTTKTESSLPTSIILVYKQWAKQIDRYKNMMTNLAYILEPVGIRVAMYDAFENFADEEMWKFPKFWSEPFLYILKDDINSRSPTLIADANPEPLDDHDATSEDDEVGHKWKDLPFTQSAILKSLKKLVPEVEHAWLTVKEKVQERRRIVAKEAEEARIKKEEEDKKAQEEAEKLDEYLTTIEKVDVSEEGEEGGAFKQTLEKGRDGETPSIGSQVYVHYTGKLLNGQVFDSSRERDEVFQFKLGTQSVIKCWDRAFRYMSAGEKAVLTCTPSYAYGETGSPPKIPPNATLRFEVELISFDGPEILRDEL